MNVIVKKLNSIMLEKKRGDCIVISTLIALILIVHFYFELTFKINGPLGVIS